MFTKESLDALRNKIDLVEVLSPYIEFKRSGAAFKALCPFHDEKTPSFMIQRGDTHYHCFGCGAHGDAIAFLMDHQRLSFFDAVENLAEKFHVHLEKMEMEEEKGPSKQEMRRALDLASRLYHTLLLQTPEGHRALAYLEKRGIDLEFVKRFEIGFAHPNPSLLMRVLTHHGISEEIAEACGLRSKGRDFFVDRILFPIRQATGHVIGFSGRKFKEETFGGKYVNTPETPLFKKSRVLFGLNYSRQRIAKERIALIVEGQIDALRLIQNGFDFTVAGQGTAFGETHVEELIRLGVLTVVLAFDSDTAGKAAAVKVGGLFQKQGIEVKVIHMQDGYDPDQFVREKGPDAFLGLIQSAEEYLAFLVEEHANELDLSSPAIKNDLASRLGQEIRSWNEPLMVHESLKKLASLLHVPESLVGVGQLEVSPLFYKKSGSAGLHDIDPHFVIEADVLIWLLSPTPEITNLTAVHLTEDSFKDPICKATFNYLIRQKQKETPVDWLMLSQLEEGKGQKLVAELTSRKVNRDKPELYFRQALQTLLDRNWLERREEVKQKIHSAAYDDEEALALAKEFEEVKRCKPQV